MDSNTKNAWDVFLNIVTMIGATIAFGIGLRQWRRGQEWQRAERLDKFVELFEGDKALQTAATVLDWTCCNAEISGLAFDVDNDEVLLALRDHQKLKPGEGFAGNQMPVRRAYDALLSFFGRLEMAITGGLVDVAPARQYFRYWLVLLITFERHGDKNKVLGGQSPAEMVKGYIEAYGDPKSIQRLCQLLEVEHPLWKPETEEANG